MGTIEKMKPIRTITLVREDQDPHECYVDTIDVYMDVDIEEAIKAAASEYLHTEEGRAYLFDTNGGFNYGDAVSAIPDEITRKHGYIVRLANESPITVTVDQNEHLVPADIERRH